MERIGAPHWSSGDVSFTRGQYWLLEAVVEYRIQLAEFRDADYCCSLDRSAHGMPKDILVQTIETMLAAGLIEIVDASGSAQRTLADVRMMIDAKTPPVWYGLTDRGGTAWEAFACPHWNWYIQDTWSRDQDSSGRHVARFACRHEGVLTHYLDDLDTWLRGKGLSTIERVSQGKTTRWRATYWKEFDSAFEMVVKAPRVIAEHDPSEWPVALDFPQDWYTLRM